MIENLSLVKFHRHYISGTSAKVMVADLTILLCTLTKKVEEIGLFVNRKGYINTKVVKHLFDSKPAEEYEFILVNLVKIVRYPDGIYKNLDSKRGNLVLVKRLGEDRYLCSVEASKDEKELNMVVTAFRIRKENYLKDYKLLWSWKGDKPSS